MIVRFYCIVYLSRLTAEKSRKGKVVSRLKSSRGKKYAFG